MKANSKLTGTKRGYLHEDFLFFHLKDSKSMEFDSHFHDFNKIIIFISGKVTYYVEGTAYKLQPWDILLISNKEVHKPLIEQGEIYERIVIWINSIFLESHSSSDCNLLNCFKLASDNSIRVSPEDLQVSYCDDHKLNNSNLLRLDVEKLNGIRSLLLQLEETLKSKEFGSRLLGNSLLIQFMIYLNRSFLGRLNSSITIDFEYDETINSLLAYINNNLKGDLSIKTLSDKFFLSRYYLMHKFKIYTGYTIHSYIVEKRLLMANELIKKGQYATTVALECGFCDYSSFLRAYKKKYGYSPKQHYKNMRSP